MKNMNRFQPINLTGIGLGNNYLRLENISNGKDWHSKECREIPNPLNGRKILTVPDTKLKEMSPFLKGLKDTPSYGLHNPFHNVERYTMLAKVCGKASDELSKPEVAEYFAKLIQLCVAKADDQCMGEVVVVRNWLENFRGDRVRFLASCHGSPGDHFGQQPIEYRFPFGPVIIIAPFNFPLEIPALQTLSSLFMGNRPLVKVDSKVSVVMAEFLRLLHTCGLPLTDVDLLHCRGEEMGKFVAMASGIAKLVQFTGSSEVARKLRGIIPTKKEDSGFDWKILGPDYRQEWMEPVCLQCQKDAYGFSGQKCSAQSMLFIHKNWRKQRVAEKLESLASKCSLENKTIGPLLSVTTEKFLNHTKALSEIPGAYVMFGGKELKNHTIPKCYGAVEPTAVFVPFDRILENHKLVFTEIFGPLQVVTMYGDPQVPKLLEILEKIPNRLTAGIVSNDMPFIHNILGHTTNGTIYAGMNARTTGALQNQFFGPCGSPEDAGIHTDRAIVDLWSGPRCINFDHGS
jgi:1-pyrroline-5-carboxylate dehydrogenase